MPTKPLAFGNPIKYPGCKGAAASRFTSLQALCEHYTCPLHTDMQPCAGPICQHFKAGKSHGESGRILRAICKCHAPTGANVETTRKVDGLAISESRDGAALGYVQPNPDEEANWLQFGQDWAGKAGAV